jgi:TRAP-type C4-dicarboxylate transport system substrate-binding protein
MFKKGFLAAALLLFCVSSVYAKPQYVFKFAQLVPEREHIGQAVNKFAELAKQKSGGKIEVRVFHGGQLGSGKETFEAVQAGFIDFAGDSYANIYTLTPAFEPAHLPYFFNCKDQLFNFYRSDKVREIVNNRLAPTGLKWVMGLSWTPRNIGTIRKPIRKFEDIQGLKLRASRSPLELAAHKAWGAVGITIDWPETAEALRLGMVDGVTVATGAFWGAKHHEGLTNYITVLNFQTYGYVVMANAERFKKLPEDVRRILEESASEAQIWHQEMLIPFINDNIREMKEAGVEVIILPPEEEKKFRDASMSVWDHFVGTMYPEDYVNLLQSEVGKCSPEDEQAVKGWGLKFD